MGLPPVMLGQSADDQPAVQRAGQITPDQQQTPQQGQPDQIEQLKQSLAQQAMTPQGNAGGVKGLLQNFFTGMGQSMMHEAGLPTQYEKQQRALGNLSAITNAQGLLELHKQMASQYQPVPLVGLDGKPLTMPDGSPVTLPAMHANTWYQGQLQAASRIGSAQIGAGAKVDVANIMQGGGLQLPVDKTTATLAGVPELEGKGLGMGGWKMLNSALQARGYHVQDMGVDGPGPQQGMWVVDRGGNPVNQVSDKSVTKARGIGYAQGRAMYTPFDTVEPGTNTPTTISNLQAIQSGAPRVSTTQAASLGGKYALFNDAYGILDNVEKMVGNNPGQVNLDDAATRARVTSAYSALKEPAAKGLTGEVLSNFLLRQPISASLNDNERQLALTMAQGKAAATGLRGILGQAGTNEMQQRLDSAMMPGAQAGGNDAIRQQTKSMRGLLDRVAVGQPNVGLNAPNTPTNLANKGGGAVLTADEARSYLLKAGGDKDKARALARADGRKF